jgi:hypothetical protein
MRKRKKLVDTNERPPTLPTGHLSSNVYSDYHWSSTPAICSPTGDRIYCLSFYAGSIMG